MSMTLCWMKIDLIVYCGCLGNKGWSLPYCCLTHTYLWLDLVTPPLSYTTAQVVCILLKIYNAYLAKVTESQSHSKFSQKLPSHRWLSSAVTWPTGVARQVTVGISKSQSYSKFLQSHKRLSSTVIWIVVSQTVAMSVSLLHQECIKTDG